VKIAADRSVIAAAARARRECEQAGDPAVHVVFEQSATADVVWSTAPQLRQAPADAFTPGGWVSCPVLSCCAPATSRSCTTP
jgi:hypothetical protein